MTNLLSPGIKFLVVGAISTGIELAVFNLALLVLDWDPIAAKAAGSLVALINAYFGNRGWAFRDRAHPRRWLQVLLFVAVNAACTALGIGLVAAGSLLVEPRAIVAINLINLASIAIVVALRFVLYHHLVFPPTRPSALGTRGTERPG